MIRVTRETAETRIRLELDVAGGAIAVRTGDGFLDHFVTALARHARLGLSLEASGDLRHHLVEDVSLALGRALAEACPPTCVRYGERSVPMDDAWVWVSLDAGGRPYYAGRLPVPIWEHALRSLAFAAGFTIHLRVLRGRDRHHVVEAAFKALGLALREALADGGSVASTKGRVRLSLWRPPCSVIAPPLLIVIA